MVWFLIEEHLSVIHTTRVPLAFATKQNSFAVLNCLDTEKTCPEEADQQLVMQSAGASYVQPQAGDETH